MSLPDQEPAAVPASPPRRESPLLRRSPLWAVPALLLCGWLLWDSWPEVAFFFSSRQPIDLGAPGGYHLDRARPNRLVRIAGAMSAAVGVTDARAKEERTVLGLRGVNLAVDRPGVRAPTLFFEGRLLPGARTGDYGEAIAALRARGWEAGDRVLVLRDGERPGNRWAPVAWSALLLLLAVVNGRALWKSLWQ